jgi:benzoyl-CoA reductase/2-hydroxyglutaryl-CoA dehydratase subunit BcrC/BadD/HgdB
LPYVYFLELPHILGSSAFKLFSSELYRFKQSIEEFIGEQINDEVLKEAIRLHNQNRALVRQLYELRKPDPPLVTGAEVVRIIGAGLSLPISQFNSLLEEVISEVSSRQPPQSKPVRLLIYGSVIDNPPFLELVEGYGACAVMDDIAIGSRTFWFEVREDIDPITALSRAYLTGIRCPRTIQGKRKEIRREELLDKFGYLLKYIQDFGVNAVIAYILRFCDIHQFDFPDLAQFIKETVGVPVLYIDDDYTLGSMPRLKTRLEAFIEMVKEGSHGNSASH